ncbi:uncharacterized protein LOC144927803 [Branchiostoma floridae x Branchiostoma belcheri]
MKQDKSTTRKDCYVGNGATYRGQVNTTDVGLVCQRWEDQTPHEHRFMDLSKYGLSENYCRNPDNEERPWCYTLDPSARWQYCPVKPCGCRSGYQMHNGICYKAFNTPMNFLDAFWTCRTEGGTLAMPKDASTNNFLISLKHDVDHRGPFWLGLVDRRVEGVWEWVDGTRLGNYSAWLPGEPDNKNNEDCAHYCETKWTKWNDVKCDRSHIKFICQVKPEAAKSDGCRVGYKLLATVCVRINFRTMSHKKATEACEKEGARLAMPKTKELDMALRNLVRTEGQNMSYWIGLFDKESFYLSRRRWSWVDGSTLGSYKGAQNEHGGGQQQRACAHDGGNCDKVLGFAPCEQ